MVKTIVTTDLIADIARHFGVDCYDTLTGFKYIAEIIRELEGKKQFIVGGEESYGYLSGDFVRDKDAISSCAMLSEMTAWAVDQGMSPFDLLTDIYSQFGFYRERLISITKKGASGAEEIRDMMQKMRSTPPETLGGARVSKLLDYQDSTGKNMLTGSTFKLDFPKSNVLQYITEDGSKVSARPSGTEPKIKFYFSVRADLEKPGDFDHTDIMLNNKIDRIIEELGLN